MKQGRTVSGPAKGPTRVKVGSFELRNNGDWSYFCLPDLYGAGIVHGFCTKTSPWKLLDKRVRNDFLGAFLLSDIVIMNQEHGDVVHTITNGMRPERGDGVILAQRNVAGIIKTADCLPIILCDVSVPAVSIIHSGWRGTARKILLQAIAGMERVGAKRANITALVGPSIGPCCYEVKVDVASAFLGAGFPPSILQSRKDSLFLDIKEANLWLLETACVTRVYDLALCTQCGESLFHSYRRGDVGMRQINFVSIRG
jgi:polyphenol oxidase